MEPIYLIGYLSIFPTIVIVTIILKSLSRMIVSEGMSSEIVEISTVSWSTWYLERLRDHLDSGGYFSQGITLLAYQLFTSSEAKLISKIIDLNPPEKRVYASVYLVLDLVEYGGYYFVPSAVQPRIEYLDELIEKSKSGELITNCLIS